MMSILEKNKKTIHRVLLFAGLQLSILMFSSAGIFTKKASGLPVFSWEFVLLYGTSIFIMLVYAVLWQQFLKHIALTTAYANKSVSTIWTMLFGYLFFNETITPTMILGAIVIIIGVFVVVTADE